MHNINSERVTILEAGRAERHYWRDLWHYRELFLILAWRDVSVRYKQTAIGIVWAFIRPFLTMIVFSTLFGRLAKLPSDGSAPYPIMVLAGMLPWFLFSSIIADASNSVSGNANLISKVYFPRLLIPLATTAVAVVDFAINLFILVLMMLWFRFIPNWHILFLPVFILLAVAASLGPSLWIASLNVKYRDFRFVIPFITQFGLYVSPVGFSSAVVPVEWRALYSFNPVVAIIDGFRWCLLGDDSRIYWPGFCISFLMTVLFLWVGIRTFRSTERNFADIV